MLKNIVNVPYAIVIEYFLLTVPVPTGCSVGELNGFEYRYRSCVYRFV